LWAANVLGLTQPATVLRVAGPPEGSSIRAAGPISNAEDLRHAREVGTKYLGILLRRYEIITFARPRDRMH
jgi:hypothetical protein